MVFFLTGTSGCTNTIHPPTSPSDAVPVYVTNYGKHSSVVLPLKEGGYVEWGFGDWNWFALNKTSPLDAIRALFFSPQATLSRRVMWPQATDEDLRHNLSANSLIRIEVSEDRVEQLMRQLDARYARHGDTQVYSTLSYMEHVKDPEHYWLFNNCNHFTAQWLRDLGCRVDGTGVTSDFRLAK
jgi:hypothetical protein